MTELGTPTGRRGPVNVETDVLREPSPAPASARPLRGAALVSIAIHAGLLLLALLAVRQHARTDGGSERPEPLDRSVIYLARPGPSGGGGGGGNRAAAPSRQASAPGRDRVTVPVQRSPAQTLSAPEPEPVPQLLLAAMPMAAGVVTMAGVVDADRASRPDSLGAGDGGGADRGRGTGIGPGAGSGLGDGVGGGADGGVYRIGTGVTAPQLLRSVRPSYTPEAMRLRLTGTVILECVVDTGGRVERCQLQRSLDRRYGLDEEAMKAAHQWTFVPGTRLGQAVPVFVRLELSFSIQ